MAVALVLFTAGCASDFRSLVPGQATGEDVERVMGPAAEKRAAANGETVLWFPQPGARANYAARIGKDGRLIAVEQRLTRENLDQVKRGVSREADVRDLLGPPKRIDAAPRQQRSVWTYDAQGPEPQLIVVQFSADGVAREAYMFNDPAMVALGAGGQ
jgi:hypothetical protein